MSKTAEFKVMVGQGSAKAFAELSGDWNPLHTDADYAATTTYGQPILHGAFSAGLVSRMAGMHLPGESCLLHGMRLRFVAPVVPPAKLVVRGVQVASNRVEVTVDDADTCGPGPPPPHALGSGGSLGLADRCGGGSASIGRSLLRSYNRAGRPGPAPRLAGRVQVAPSALPPACLAAQKLFRLETP